MRTVKQTADELVGKFRKLPPCSPYTGVGDGEAIKCAIIAVDEILNVVHTLKSEQYWIAVKKELKTRLNK